MLGKTATLQIQTPEGVAFQLPLASPVTRGIAFLIDFAVILSVISIANMIMSLFTNLFNTLPVIGDVLNDFTVAVRILLFFLIFMLYGAFLEWWWKGRTVGKRIMGLRVVDERGLSLSAGQVVLRNLFRLLDSMPSFFYLIGGISCGLSKRCQRLGDIASGTVVVREISVPQPEIDEILDESDNSFSTLPHLEGRLRQNTGPEDARIALDAVLRRDRLGEANRLVVFREIADHFRQAADFPEEITVGLSDEQYVRNVVDSLFRRTGSRETG